ncbi:MAG: hypothetical protein COA91_09130 [Robiginitomaculum sp.]|nr:MAG: hypothetical protein COA91_09130 [Robiginitomaculum sp.]
MLLRSITKHVKDQNWFAVALDFLIVVAGILIAFQVTNWNEARQNKVIANEYLFRIQNDLILNQKDMEVRQQYFETVKAHALHAIEAIDGPPEALGQQFISDSWFATFALRRTIVRESFEELLSVGAMNNVTDVSARQRIAQYYRSTEGTQFFLTNIPPYRELLRGVLPYEVQAALRKAGCTGSYNMDAAGSPTAIIHNDCQLKLTDAQISDAIEKLNTPEFRFALNIRLADIDTKLLLIGTINNRAQNLYEYLEEVK